MFRTTSSMCGMSVVLVLCCAISQGWGAPAAFDDLVTTAVLLTGEPLNGGNSNYNPRQFGGNNFTVQINNTSGIARYPSGEEDAAAAVPLAGGTGGEARMVSPFDGGNSTEWLLLAGGANETQFSRLAYDAMDDLDREFAQGVGLEPNSFDWVDNDTIIYSSYEIRTELYLADVTADPFDVIPNTAWNSQGFVPTDAQTRIRNVRVGDVYGGYAYFGDAGQANDAGVWAIDLATGETTEVTFIETVTGGGSWGVWTIKEVDGYLYVHTTDDGVYVYNMTDAVTIADMAVHYTKEELDILTGTPGQQYWGFDVVQDGAVMLLGGTGQVTEISDLSRSNRCDLNGDGAVDAADAGIMFGAWGNNPGSIADKNGDGVVDAADAGELFAAWTGEAPVAGEGDATAAYNWTNGLIEISANGVVNVFVESASGGLAPGSTDAAPAGVLVSDNASRVGLTGFGGISVVNWKSQNATELAQNDLSLVVGPALGAPLSILRGRVSELCLHSGACQRTAARCCDSRHACRATSTAPVAPQPPRRSDGGQGVIRMVRGHR